MRIQRFLTVCMLALLATSAFALERPFPANAKRGVLNMGPFPEIALNGQPRRMSAGGRIFNEQNLIQMPASVTGNNLMVNYTEDFQGNVDRVWILTEQEAAQTPAQQKINAAQAPQAQILPDPVR
ncbi:hypothetical protein [Noviherbaspirillum sedimenti]|uniref:Uncharacterized protein n=1 Tax=Noviherbaspirillum sedimenti TaxID=2320865 RepID=A0A3A3G6H2_9BURK|nr:hypothetical protein [Noviherbaspirillum sedimenti]RJG02132.1 hypothetical protein D3878_11540 [Noviherbaspirillum sedimenti]